VLDPKYEEHADAILDKIQHDPSRQALWNAICDAIDLICDHPDSAEARREAVRRTRYTMFAGADPVPDRGRRLGAVVAPERT